MIITLSSFPSQGISPRVLFNDCLGPCGDVVSVALERLAVGHAEQQAGLGVVNGVVIDIQTVSQGDTTLAINY